MPKVLVKLRKAARVTPLLKSPSLMACDNLNSLNLAQKSAWKPICSSGIGFKFVTLSQSFERITLPATLDMLDRKLIGRQIFGSPRFLSALCTMVTSAYRRLDDVNQSIDRYPWQLFEGTVSHRIGVGHLLILPASYQTVNLPLTSKRGEGRSPPRLGSSQSKLSTSCSCSLCTKYCCQLVGKQLLHTPVQKSYCQSS